MLNPKNDGLHIKGDKIKGLFLTFQHDGFQEDDWAVTEEELLDLKNEIAKKLKS